MRGTSKFHFDVRLLFKRQGVRRYIYYINITASGPRASVRFTLMNVHFPTQTSRSHGWQPANEKELI